MWGPHHLAVGALNLESVLEKDNVDLSLLELALLLEESGEGLHRRSSLVDLLVGEQTELAELGGEDLVLVGGERAER